MTGPVPKESVMHAAINWGSGVSNAWSDVVTFVPKLVIFLVILLLGWLIARVLASVTDRILERVGFDRAVERGGVGRAMAHTKYDASDLVAKLVFYAIFLIALVIAFNVWGPNPVSDLLSQLVAWLPRLLVAIVIVVVAAAIARAVKDLITGALGGLSYGRLLANIASIFILGLGIIAALNQIGVATTVTTPVLIAVLATIAGVLIVGVGGGLVRPMQSRWDRWLDQAEAEVPRVAAEAQSSDGIPAAAPARSGTTGAVRRPEPVEGSVDPTLRTGRRADVDPEADPRRF